MSAADAPWYMQPIGSQAFVVERDELLADARLSDAVPRRCAHHRSFPDGGDLCQGEPDQYCEDELDARRRRRDELGAPREAAQ